MNRYLPFLFLFLIAATARAQTIYTSLDCERNTKLVSSVSAPDGTTCLLGYNNSTRKLHVWLVDQNGNVASASSHLYDNIASPNIIGSAAAPGTFTFYVLETNTIHNGKFLDNGEQVVRELRYDVSAGKLMQNTTAIFSQNKHDKFVTSFKQGSLNYTLFYNKKADSLQVVSYKDLAGLYVQKFNIGHSFFDSRFDTDNFYFASGAENSLPSQAHIRNKAYLRNENLYFIFDAPGAYEKYTTTTTTHILRFNLITGNYSASVLPELQYGDKTKFNSYLFEETLFRLVISKDQLSLTAFDLQDNQQKASFEYTAAEDITLRVNAGTWGTKYQRSILQQDSKSVLKLMANGTPAVAAYSTSDTTIELTIGSFLKPSGQGYTMSSAGSGAPAMYFPAASLSGEGTSYQFKSSLSYPALSITPAFIYGTPYNQIEDYIFQQQRKGVSIEPEFVYEREGKVYVAVRNKKLRVLELLEFSSRHAQLP